MGVRIRDLLLDLLFPQACPVCAGRVSPDGTCPVCRLELEREVPRCDRCARALHGAAADGPGSPTCAGCGRGRGPRFDRCRCVGDYARPGLREAILRFKHAPAPGLAEPLGRLLVRAVLPAMTDPNPLWVPVPLHPDRRFERGFDQADLLARAMEATGIGERCAALRRIRAAPPQGSPFAGARESNVRGVFRLRQRSAARIRGREIWLVDDVGTTLSTADEAARLLRRARPARCSLALLARAEGGVGGSAAGEPSGSY